METEGIFAPDSRAGARERYATLAPVAAEVVRAVTREMDFDGAEYDRRVTAEVERAAQDAIFASLLEVRWGPRAAFDEWRTDYAGDLKLLGSDNVDNVVWHAGPDGAAVAATFQGEREAAVGTLRRQAFGSIYSEVVR